MQLEPMQPEEPDHAGAELPAVDEELVVEPRLRPLDDQPGVAVARPSAIMLRA